MTGESARGKSERHGAAAESSLRRARSLSSNVISRPVAPTHASWGIQTASVMLFAAAVLSPLPFGSVSQLAVAIWLAWLSCAALLATITAARRDALMMALIALAAFAYVGLAVLQTMTPPLAGPTFPLWSEASAVLGQHLTPQTASVGLRPWQALDSPLLGVVSVICGIAVATRRTYVRRFLLSFARFGVGYAGFGLVWYLAAPGYVLWWPKESHIEDLTATFTNRNTAAVFIGIALIILVSQASALTDRYMSAARRQQTSTVLRHRRELLLTFGQILICLLAILLTNSRAGGLLSLFAAAIAAGLRLRRRYVQRRGYQLLFVGLTILAAIFLVFILVDTRLSTSGLEDGGRFATYRATLQMALDHPWLGVGLGCFSQAFPFWRNLDTSMWGVWNRAHNSPLELAAEAGLPFAGMMLVGWIVVLTVFAREAWRRQSHVSASVFAICALGVSHCLVDFSIQIPGFQIIFYAVVGIGIGQLSSRKIDRRLKRRQLPFDDADFLQRKKVSQGL